MIFKNQLQRLAKLRQFKGGDLEEWMTTEFRQNMLAIESAIKNLSIPPNYLSCQLSSLSVANNTEEFFTFAAYTRTTNANQDGEGGYKVKQDGNYLMTMNLAGVLVNGIKDITVYIYRNGNQLIGNPVMRTDSTNQFTVPFHWIIELQLEADDVLTFSLSNTSASNSNVCTVAYGFLEMKQLTQG